MKFPHSMLLDYVQTDLDANALGDLLTMAGFELEGIEEVEGEPVLDIKVMSNRGDGLSVFGLSREVLAKDLNAKPTALYQRAVSRFADIAATDGDPALVSVETDLCTRYAGATFEFPGGETPAWMAKRLTQAGMRPISLLVDLTNYISLEIGQPLHTFDRTRLAEGRIIVRLAKPGEKLKTLNGDEHELAPNHMVICDATHPVAVAGVMGGEESEVTDSTKQVLLEAAHFVNTSVRKTRKQLNLNTDSSYRFERSVDRELTLAGIRRFVDLMNQFCGSAVVPSLTYVAGPEDQPQHLTLRADRASTLLGMPVTLDQAANYLSRLGFQVRVESGALDVVVPTWRPDITREIDLIEELGRVHGYERIPETPIKGTNTQGGIRGRFLQQEKLQEALIRLGYLQMTSHSLRTEHPLDDQGERIAPRVPASPEYAILRNSLLPGLAEAFRKNGGRDLHLFEIGRVFRAVDGGYEEKVRVALLSSGATVPARRKGDVVPQADFYSLKATLESLLASLGVGLELKVVAPDARFHPTRQAAVVSGDATLGVMGQIHPDVAKAAGLPEATVLAELLFDELLPVASEEIGLKSISRHPAIDRDIAVLVSKTVPFGQLELAIRNATGDLLEKLSLFDVYEGSNLPEGTHSLGVRVRLRKLDGTFTDAEANQVREQIVSVLAELGATTR